MNEIFGELALTPEQRQFADEHHATAMVSCAVDHVVCLYGYQTRGTVRWIVDDHGRLLEETEFTRAAS
jgi:hypothetical protein